MQKINANKVLQAEAIYLKGNNRPLRDRYIKITERFLIVAENSEDTAPVWYNLDSIHKLVGVKIPEAAQPEPGQLRLTHFVYM